MASTAGLTLLLLLPLAFCVTFDIDVSAPPTQFPHLWESSVGSCHGTTALRADWRQQISNVHKDLGSNFVRFHGILDDDMSVVLDDGTFSFFNIDFIFDFLVSIGMKPLVELSFMPELYASGTATVFHYKGNITPPKNYSDWNNLITTLANHLIERYGINEVSSWYFEVWNEPNCGFFYQGGCCGNTGCGNQTAYFELYQNTANALKKANQQLRVGGPATAQLGWIDEFVNFVTTNKVPVDFVSSHLYPTDPEVAQNKSGFSDAIAAAAKKTGGLPFLLTEYNSGLGINVADVPYTAAFVVHTASALSTISNLAVYSFWTFSDIFEEQGFISVPYHDGFGMETIYAVPKPVYRAFEILHESGTLRLPVSGSDPAAEVLALIEKQSSGQLLTLLIANYNYHGQPINSASVTVNLNNVSGQLPSTANLRRIDDDHANGITAWQAAGSPTYPSSQVINQMQAASELKIEEVAVTSPQAGQYSITLTVPAYGVAEIKINLPAGKYNRADQI